MSSSLSVEVPPHVPAHLVVDFDYHREAGLMEDPHATLALLQKYPELIYTARNGGHWISTRAQSTAEVLKHPELFSSSPPSIPLAGAFPIRLLPLEADPPEHSRYRKPLNPLLAYSAVSALEPRIRETIVNLIASFHAKGECEFVADVAHRLPIEVFLQLVDLPLGERLKFIGWSHEVHRYSSLDQRRAGQQKTIEYLRGVVAARIRSPGTDLISQLVRADAPGGPFNADEVLGLAVVLFFGGLDTVASTISFIALYLARHPQQRRELAANPELIGRGAAEELIRVHGIVNVARNATHDFVFRNVQFRKKDPLLCPLALFGLDERENDDPTMINLRRANVSHAHFSTGPHRCPGAHLARIEIRVFLEEWLRRIPDFEVKKGAKVVTYGGPIMGMHTLPLAWDAAGPLSVSQTDDADRTHAVVGNATQIV